MAPNMQFLLVYVNCVSAEESKRIGKALVKDKMAASANIFNQTLAYYYWEGELKEDEESTLILQVRADRMDEVSERIKSMHSYEVPCIFSVSIEDGSAEFMDWMQRVLPADMPREASDGV